MKLYAQVILAGIMVFFVLFFHVSCDSDDETLVGSEKDIRLIKDVHFTVTEREVSSNKLKASALVKNTGTTKITPPWYIDGEFYADSTKKLILGGDATTINVPLDKDVEAMWTLEFSSSDIAEGSYPDFIVTNMRAYYKE